MKTVGIILAIAPFSASADLLDVQYEGTVYSADAGAPYKIGDHVSGRLQIDTRLAGRDKHPGDPGDGLYGNLGNDVEPDVGPDFIHGFGAIGAPASDFVSVRNDFPQLEGLTDAYGISDHSSFGAPEFRGLDLSVVAPATWFSNDGLVQTFTATPGNAFDLEGTLATGWDETRLQVDFVMSWFKVTPGSCHP